MLEELSPLYFIKHVTRTDLVCISGTAAMTSSLRHVRTDKRPKNSPWWPPAAVSSCLKVGYLTFCHDLKMYWKGQRFKKHLFIFADDIKQPLFKLT